MVLPFESLKQNRVIVETIAQESKKEQKALLEEVTQNNFQHKELFPHQPKTLWDKWQGWQTDHFNPHAEVAKEQYRVYNGIEFQLDGNMTFVKVPPGWSREKLLNTVRKIRPNGRDLSYLSTKSNQLKSLNMSSEQLKEEQKRTKEFWVPLPAHPKERQLSDKQFLNYCHQAITEILSHENKRDDVYRQELTEILKHVKEKDLLAMMMAIAKQESGNPIGQFSFHKWESGTKAFSCSLFHILIDSYQGKDTAGLIAAKRLGMTRGQMMHPKNAAKLFIGFYCEKYRSAHPGCTHEEIAQYIAEFCTSAEGIAAVHNGTNWEEKNPSYADSIRENLKQAKGLL